MRLRPWSVNENAFASIVQARPCPPLADRFIFGAAPIDYGPVLLRRPFGFHLAMDTLPSGGLRPRPTTHYRRLWIWRPSFEHQRDFNPPEQRAAQHTLRPLLTSAVRVKTPHDAFSHESVTHSRSPVISPTTFPAQPPDLPPVLLMDGGFAISCSLAQHRRPQYPVLVHRLACLLHASFRPHLAVTPLRFANPSPPSGWVEDLHLQAVEHARHTTGRPRGHRGHFPKRGSYGH